MNINFRLSPRHFLALALVIAMATVIGACSSAPKLSSVEVTPASSSLVMGSGITPQFTATGTYADGSQTDVSSVVTWASSDTKAATISADGFATGLAAGETAITASLSGVTSPPVTLKVLTLSSIALTPVPTADVVGGTNQQFTATGTFSDGSKKDITSEVTWASSNYAATIAAGGLANFRDAGKANITASLSGVTSPPVALTVILKLSSITLAPAAPPDLAVGKNKFFGATGTYSNGSKADISLKVTWVSSDPGVAALIPAAPGFTGVAPGKTNITASFEGITSPPVTMTVIAASP